MRWARVAACGESAGGAAWACRASASVFAAVRARAPEAPICFKNDRLVLSLHSMGVLLDAINCRRRFHAVLRRGKYNRRDERVRVPAAIDSAAAVMKEAAAMSAAARVMSAAGHFGLLGSLGHFGGFVGIVLALLAVAAAEHVGAAGLFLFGVGLLIAAAARAGALARIGTIGVGAVRIV